MLRSPTPIHQRNSGFALVLSLFLMTFVLIILVTMTVMVQVETSNSSLSLSRLRAQEAARLALMLAIGDLQKYAGPDQRVTARADILGDGNYAPEAKFWTGVWDTTNPTVDPVWLMSGDTTSLSNAVTSDNITLDLIQLTGTSTSGTDTNDHIYAPAVDLNNTNGSTTGQIAWWISDEGIKATISLIDRSEDIPDGFFTNALFPLSITEQKQILRQISPRRNNTDVFFSNDTNLIPQTSEDSTSPEVESRTKTANDNLEKAKSIHQLALLTGITENELRNASHDWTFAAKNVIANSENGGLKIDLSDQSYTSSTGGVPINTNLKTFLWNSAPDSSGSMALIGVDAGDVSSYTNGAPVQTTPPIITEFSLYFAVSGITAASRTAKPFLQFQAEVWSPYGFRHDFIGTSGSSTPELRVEFENLPVVSLSYYDRDTGVETSSNTLDLNTIDPEFDLNLSNTFKSGEMRKTNGEWPANASSVTTNFYYTNLWNWTVVDESVNSDHRNTSAPDGDYIHYTAPSSLVNVVIKNQTGDIMQRIEKIPFGGIDTVLGFYEASPSSLDNADAPILFYYRMLDDKPALEAWLSEVDPRSLILDLSQPEIRDLIDVNDQNGDNMGDPDIPVINGFSNIDFFHGQTNNNYYRIYDIPAATPTSLGVLQHLQFFGARPFSIGNSWGGTKNQIFDQYFISTIPQDITSSYWNLQQNQQSPLPNQDIEILNPEGTLSLSDLIGTNSAEHLLIRGGFNVNSTSIDAWRSLLSGNQIFNWEYILNLGTSTEERHTQLSLENAFFRLPFSGHVRSMAFSDYKFPFEDYEDEFDVEDNYPELNDTEKELIFRSSNGFASNTDWKPSLVVGNRELTNSQITDLATKIVEQIQQRAQPFTSLESFINSGILEDSIARTDINTIVSGSDYVSANDDTRLPKNATAYLSQADIISALSPKLFTRSDTFTIRARGDALNPMTGKLESTYLCEAILQRLPETINNSNPMANSTEFGRRFQIVNITWLNPSDI